MSIGHTDASAEELEHPHQMLCFLHLPKTGGSTLNGSLRRSYGPRHVDLLSLSSPGSQITSRDARFAARIHPGMCSVSNHRVCPNANLGDETWSWFTILREPVARTISEYQFYRNRLKGDLTLEQYVETKDIHNLQVRRIAGDENLETATATLQNRFFFAGIMEEFDLSLSALEVLCPDTRLSTAYRRRNTASDHRIATELRRDPGVLRYISQVTNLDAELFATVRDKIFPECVAQAQDKGQLRDIASHSVPQYSANLLSNRLVRNAWYKPVVKVARTLVPRNKKERP